MAHNKVLVFDASYILVAIFASAKVAAKFLGISIARVHQLCNGDGIASQKNLMYLRWLDKEMEVPVHEDVGHLTVFGYDKVYGESRVVYPTETMERPKGPNSIKTSKKKDESIDCE
jgi:hypothetical protein